MLALLRVGAASLTLRTYCRTASRSIMPRTWNALRISLRSMCADLQAALGHCDHQAGRFEAGNHLAHRAQRHLEQPHQLALGNKLPAPVFLC